MTQPLAIFWAVVFYPRFRNYCQGLWHCREDGRSRGTHWSFWFVVQFNIRKLMCTVIIMQELVKKFVNVTQCEKKYGASESRRVCETKARVLVDPRAL